MIQGSLRVSKTCFGCVTIFHFTPFTKKSYHSPCHDIQPPLILWLPSLCFLPEKGAAIVINYWRTGPEASWKKTVYSYCMTIYNLLELQSKHLPQCHFPTQHRGANHDPLYGLLHRHSRRAMRAEENVIFFFWGYCSRLVNSRGENFY